MWPVNPIEWNSSAQASMSQHLLPELNSSHLLRVLDEIDYGILVVNTDGHILHSNHLARHELASGNVIFSHGRMLMGATTELTEQIELAVAHACRGQRRLVLLPIEGRELSAAFIPLSHPLETDSPTVLVLLSRQNTCDNLAVRMFARSHGLSSSEESVLIGLCAGLSVPEIAQSNGVAHSTVRSQVKSLREKTASTSVRQLMRRVSSLPPVVPALRINQPMRHNATEFAHP
ncbi:MAG: LuxR family transcriptional regulator [Hydrogenophaga sp.]|uniref:helix-turn-helix transcriptional regulator n=1 Tax=Hydrogenophaga sp. TaxID=1904254 RepID=UPI002726DE2F|nr:LuxR family transcriptional regulator [Hydrogenophaga sp.]MDO9201206.1 LuxR family transcriptional regulator [Hydrogenophaga sp.]MDO9481788.1 LuxR family transcriptional regulator [Hydrogenophaga sp.]MDO9568541.1 LuxR family transcriptional regulator [Hydrogenophaga sp.]MDP1895600.1 LuxR family transcriptional regulator [Hydrogenophaga sp.]MDP2095207.1 LuxR family transcriptional regulator [Hydrogenophaga sp.]